MRGYFRALILVVGLLLLSSKLWAQEEYDYHYYKFYKEDETLISLEDTLSSQHGEMPLLGRNSEYALRALNFRDMGERGAERYTIGGCEVDYSTARMLSVLRLGHDVDLGLGKINTSSALYKTEHFGFGENYYTHDFLGINLSGRRGLGSISYFGYHKPNYESIMLNDGWEYRYASRLTLGNDLYIKGVYCDAAELSLSASYTDRRNKLNIIALLPYSKRGLSRASVEEAYRLIGDKCYNPLWGMQHGKVRNSREAKVLHPEVIFMWDYRLTVSTTMSITANIGNNRESITSLGWFDAPTPMPDNYHYLPSYHTSHALSKPVTDAWLRGDMRYTQIDWEGLYHTNMLQSDGHARYVVEERRADNTYGDIAVLFRSSLEGINIEYGLSLNANATHRYKVLNDLLGAEYINNIDYFLVDDATYSNALSNNLRNPDITIHEGDTYGYNYTLRTLRSSLFGRAYWQYGDVDITLRAAISSDINQRNGHYEKELFPNSGSYGYSRLAKFSPYSLAAIANYSLGNHLYVASAAIETRTPEIESLFLNPDYNNRLIDNFELSRSGAIRMTYGYVPSSNLSFSLQLFGVYNGNESRMNRYYDDIARCYVDAHVRGIDRLGYGTDVRAMVGWNRYLTSNFRAVVASYIYADDAVMSLYADSDNRLIANTAVALDKCHWGTSEIALYGDLAFRHQGWQVQLSLSWCDGGYIEPAYTPRSHRVLSLTSAVEEREQLLVQTNLPSASSLDFSLSKRIKLSDEQSLTLRLSVNNLLANHWIVRGYESNRLRIVAREGFSSIHKAADALNYSYPRTLRLSVNLWF